MSIDRKILGFSFQLLLLCNCLESLSAVILSTPGRYCAVSTILYFKHQFHMSWAILIRCIFKPSILLIYKTAVVLSIFNCTTFHFEWLYWKTSPQRCFYILSLLLTKNLTHVDFCTLHPILSLIHLMLLAPVVVPKLSLVHSISSCFLTTIPIPTVLFCLILGNLPIQLEDFCFYNDVTSLVGRIANFILLVPYYSYQVLQL